MPDIVCPECGQVAHLVAIRRSAEEFCTQCDFPLFWAPSAVPTTTPGSSNAASLRRLPGAGGRQRLGSKICPECGELNPMVESYCIRCTADLDPKPVAPPPAPAPVVAAPPPPEPEPDVPWWPYPAAALVVLIEIVLLIVLFS